MPVVAVVLLVTVADPAIAARPSHLLRSRLVSWWRVQSGKFYDFNQNIFLEKVQMLVLKDSF